MSIAEAWQNIESHLKADAESVKARVEQDLPELARFVSEAAANPVTQALAVAVHLPNAPGMLQTIANLIGNVEAALAAEHAAAQQPPAEPAPDAPPSA